LKKRLIAYGDRGARIPSKLPIDQARKANEGNEGRLSAQLLRFLRYLLFKPGRMSPVATGEEKKKKGLL
jgi:hypothetical protein